MRTRFPVALLLLPFLAGPAAAQDVPVDAPACDFFCKLRRNLLGRTEEGPVPDMSTATVRALPQATEGAGRPDPAGIVSQRGVVVTQDAAEKAALRRHRQAMDREAKGRIAAGEAMMQRLLGDNRPKPVR